MSFFGLGGFEILLIGAIALFVVGPKRLLEAIREGRKIYTDLKRQRDTLQTLITEAIDLEELKKQVDLDGLTDSVKKLESDLALDQVAEDVRGFLGDKVYKTIIPRNVRVSEAPSHGKPALVYDHKCAGSLAYMQLASEMLRRERLDAAA